MLLRLQFTVVFFVPSLCSRPRAPFSLSSMVSCAGDEHPKFSLGPLVDVDGGHALRDAGVLG